MAAQWPWPPVGVEQDPVQGLGPAHRGRGQRGGVVAAQPARRARAALAPGVPGVQPAGAGRERVERVLRVAQVGVVALGPVEVLTGQGEPQVLGEAWPACGLPENRAAQLAVVGPGAPVDVARADRGPGVVDDADLRVNVDRGAGVVLHVVDANPVTA